MSADDEAVTEQTESCPRGHRKPANSLCQQLVPLYGLRNNIEWVPCHVADSVIDDSRRS